MKNMMQVCSFVRTQPRRDALLVFFSLHLVVCRLAQGDIPLSEQDVDDKVWDSPFGRTLHPPVDLQPCFHNKEDTHRLHMPLPKLDTQFEARIEAKIIQKGYTVEVEEYYDYPNNRGMVRRMKNGKTSSWLYDFSDFESFLIVGSNCWLSDIRKEGFHFFNFSLSEHGGHIGGVADLFNFGTHYNETYLGGNETIGGVPVNHWSSCLQWERYNTVFQLDYYFTKPDYQSAIGRRQIPVRAVLRGQATTDQQGYHTFDHIYDFTFYRPGPIRDTRVFEVPRGTVCKHRNMQKRRPSLPDSFQMEVEMVQPEERVVNKRTYFYDYNLKLSRYDLTPNSRSMTSWGIMYGFRPITLIHDYNTGTQYVIDVVSRNCTTDAITLDTVDADPLATDPSHVIMRHGKELFDLNKLNFSYQGKRELREVKCEVWAAIRTNWPQFGTNTTVEIYFNKANWTLGADVGQESPHIVGLWLTLADSIDQYQCEWINHIYDYRSGDPPLTKFDVNDCYADDQKVTASFLVQGQYADVVYQGLETFTKSIQLQVSEIVGVHPIRVTHVMVTDAGADRVKVHFIILEESNTKGTAVDAMVPVKATEALEKLISQTSTKNLSIVVPSATKVKVYSLIQGSMVENKTQNAEQKTEPVTAGHNYSSGSMAALGITMLLIGMATGAALVHYQKSRKRPSDIPYRVQD